MLGNFRVRYMTGRSYLSLGELCANSDKVPFIA